MKKRTKTQKLVRKLHYKLTEWICDIPTMPISEKEQNRLTDKIMAVQEDLMRIYKKGV